METLQSRGDVLSAATRAGSVWNTSSSPAVPIGLQPARRKKGPTAEEITLKPTRCFVPKSRLGPRSLRFFFYPVETHRCSVRRTHHSTQPHLCNEDFYRRPRRRQFPVDPIRGGAGVILIKKEKKREEKKKHISTRCLHNFCFFGTCVSIIVLVLYGFVHIYEMLVNHLR